jgi:hypothetical protein
LGFSGLPKAHCLPQGAAMHKRLRHTLHLANLIRNQVLAHVDNQLANQALAGRKTGNTGQNAMAALRAVLAADQVAVSIMVLAGSDSRVKVLRQGERTTSIDRHRTDK